jgi:CSLREA domain-containing protein
MMPSPIRHSRTRVVCLASICAALVAFVSLTSIWQAATASAKKLTPASSVNTQPTPDKGVITKANNAITPSIAHTPTVTNAATIEDMQTTSGLVVSRNPADGPEVTHFKIGNIVGGKVFKNDGTTEIPINTFITFEEGNAGLKFTPSPNNWGSLTFEVYSSTSNSDAGVGGIFARPSITVQPLGDTASVTNATTNRNTQSSFGLVVKRNPVDGLEINFVKITNIQNGTLFKHDGKTLINNGDFITFDEAGAGLKFTPGNNLLSPATTFSFDVQASATTSDAGIGGSAVTASIGVFDPIFLTVTTLGDVADTNIGDGHCDTDGNLANGDQCTLRAAIEETNAAPGDDTVSFNLPASSIITLNTALPDLNSVTVVGPGANSLTVQRNTAGGTPEFRILTVKNDNTLNLSGLTVANGKTLGATFPAGSGGGILNNTGSLNVSDCVVTGNSALAGGGIRSMGTATIKNTTVSNNAANNLGGGISNSASSQQSGVLTLSNSTISNNNSPDGGGINNAGTFTILNSTISTNNASSGGGINSFNPMTLNNVTITGNNATTQGGGIYSPGIGAMTLNNSIIYANTSPTGPDISGANISADYDIVGNTSGWSFGSVNHNLLGINPLLGPLANNGGPTMTHALLAGSPAIDAGNSGLTTDQRGQPRPVDDLNLPNAAGGNASDIGAYETPTFQVNSLADTDDAACTLPGTGNGCTLREAITAANSQAGAELITFAPGLTSGGPATITLLTALPQLTSDMTIAGPGANLLTVQRSIAGGTPDFRIFLINSGLTVTISGLTISNGNAVGAFPSNFGGGILNFGNLTVNSSVVSGNNAVGNGGGICNLNFSSTATLTVNNTTVVNNTAAGGSGIGSDDSFGGLVTATVNNSTILNNHATGSGGGILSSANSGNRNATLTINGSTISGNSSATGSGGGVYGTAVFGGTSVITINNSTVSTNSASASGGGTYFFVNGNGSSATLTVNNGTIFGNTVTSSVGDGGGISAVFNNTTVLRNTIVAGNLRTSDATPSDISGSINSTSSFNLIGAGGSGGLTNGVNNNQVGIANPLLGPLADNGGPTMTHALLAGSPAFDAGNNSLVTNPPFSGPPFTDQRGAGFSRIVDGPDADATATVDIGAFEQQASLADIADQTTNEDVALAISFDIGDPAQLISITATSNNGVLVPNVPANLKVTGSATSSTRTLTITPAANLFGTANITVTLNTTGGTITRTFLLTVNSGNDAPSFTSGPNQTVNEDAGAQSVTNWATNMSPGPADESAQTLTFQVTGNTNPGLFGVAPAISSTGTLTYTPAANANGSATITVVLMDNGGTANGGSNTSAPQTLTITVNPVNDAPTFVVVGSSTSAIEDFGPLTLLGWATSLSAGPANESGQTLTFQVTSNTNPSLFSSAPAVSPNGNLSFTSVPDANGSATIGVVLKDNGGTANGGVDTSNARFFTINILSVNDAPSFVKGANQTVNEDAGAQTVANWATSISPGPANESTQTVTFTATNNNNALFSNQPAISSTGSLSYTPAANANGAATVSVTLKDNGGTANSGVDTSPAQTFTITVNTVNDAPSFTSGPNQSVGEDAGAQTIVNWATAIAAGPANESGQTVTFQVTSNTNAGLFSSGPAISPTGTLTYTPTANANGSATITIVLQDNGGTANSGVDTSASQTFTITVNPVNDVPSFTIGADQTVNNNAGAQTVANWATNISGGPNEVQQVNFQVTGNNNPNLFVVAPAISSTGTLTYTPATSAGGTAAITIILKDDGGTANGGQDTSPPQIFNINVNPVGGSIKFNSASGSTAENSGSTTITVTRTGDLSQAVTADYATSADPGLPCSTAGGVASPKCDFTSSLGTLTFAAGEGTKTVTVLISQDSFVEGPETFTMTLSNQTGGSALATPSTETITINDDATEPPTNSIDDAGNFVRQHYHDFLNREPDADGFAFWTNQITSCGSDQACIDLKRINVSAAFYVSVEFQGTGYLVERIYKAAYGDANGLSTFGGAHQLPVPIVRFNEFLPDTQRIGQGVVVNVGNWQQQLEDNKQAYTAEFVQRSRFMTAFPVSMTAAQFVDALNTNAATAGVKPLSQSERDQLVNDLSTSVKTRAQVLRAVAEDSDLNTAELNRAFVLMQYSGYLRRNPNDPQDTDYTGYDFWLTKLNQFNGNFVNAEMVKAFIVSGEYRQRFGP